MSLFHSVIFGPIQSRRLGTSLGVNLLPVDNKLCTFNCIYCECGWNTPGVKPRFNSRETVRQALREALTRMAAEGKTLDVITFSGNGEPTMHPDFEGIIDDTLALRDALMPMAKVSVLSNATLIGRESVRRALMKVDNNILKLDSAFDDTVRRIDGPANPDYTVASTVENLRKFNGKFILQTMFLRGTFNGEPIDNTTQREVDGWLALVDDLRPEKVMIYTIDRDTPAKDLHKVSLDELNRIAERVRALGIPCSVSG
ncbi:MAG: radical SAM protein [Rikenellaceae bacterium]|jgi:wyosine [tRNA(Phe)-imidazoG37] synthetase (radical SAM superfamily)|nr:radical SAM protein [Rikenellaceae bacterium]